MWYDVTTLSWVNQELLDRRIKQSKSGSIVVKMRFKNQKVGKFELKSYVSYLKTFRNRWTQKVKYDFKTTFCLNLPDVESWVEPNRVWFSTSDLRWLDRRCRSWRDGPTRQRMSSVSRPRRTILTPTVAGSTGRVSWSKQNIIGREWRLNLLILPNEILSKRDFVCKWQ